MAKRRLTVFSKLILTALIMGTTLFISAMFYGGMYLGFLNFNDVIKVEATVYHPVPEQTNEDYDTTASGAKINLNDPLSHKWLAVSRDLEEEGFVFGAKVAVSGAGPYDGYWIVQDRMNKRWEKRIDFLIGEYDPIGKWDNVKIQLVK